MGKFYTVAEHFYSFQGEGLHIGRAAYFVRLYGCDVQCTWCDSAFTWKKDLRPVGLKRLCAKEIAGLVKSLPPEVFVVLTGGEPCMYDLSAIVAEFHLQNRLVHVETAGHRAITQDIDFITISPKAMFGVTPLVENLKRAHQIKLICSDRADLETQLMAYLPELSNNCTVWLHPEHGERSSQELLNAITEAVKYYGGVKDIRAGWQVHKLYNADSLDLNARK